MITDDTILRAKQSYLPDLFRKHNINLIATNNGSSFKCNCPFHEESEPSLNLNHKDGLWLFHCFGCGAGGTAIDFKMKIDGVEFREAVERLVPESELKMKNVKLKMEDSAYDNSKSNIQNSKSNSDSDNSKSIIVPGCCPSSFQDSPLCRDLGKASEQNSELSRNDLLRLVVDHYHKILISGTEDKAKYYLEKRCLFDDEIIKTFKIGFSNGNANEVFKEYRVQLKDELGIFKVNYYETFVNCIIFPVLDQDGNPTDIYARRTMNYTERASHCYNKGKHQGIFNIQNIIDADSVILTEGIIDALSIYKSGFKNVTALYGINGLIPALEELLKNKKKIIFAFDNDEAGKAGIKRYSALLKHAEVLTVNFPTYIKDTNELLCKSGISAVKEVIENATLINKEQDNAELKVQSLKLKVENSDSENSKSKIQNSKLTSFDSEVLNLKASDIQKEERLKNKINQLETELDNELKIKNSDNSESIIQNLELISSSSVSFESTISKAETLNDLLQYGFSFNENDLILKTTLLNYQIRSVLDLKNLKRLSFVITVTKDDQSFTDGFDLYKSRNRHQFENAISKEFCIQTAAVEKDLNAIITFIENDFKTRQLNKFKSDNKKIEISTEHKIEAIDFLKSRNLIDLIINDISTLGYVNEDMNKLLLYLAATSRLLKKPISILIRSQSSSGKSFLIKCICDLIPPEEFHRWTGATKQALYYMLENELKHKFVAIDEKKGMEEAEYPIRSLQSEGVLTLAVPLKNMITGAMNTVIIKQEGPISYVDGSTDTRTNPENANRCFEMYLDETAIQTKLIQKMQREAHSLMSIEKKIEIETIMRKHQNAQRLLKSVKVVIPFIDLLDFPSDWVRTRRDNDRFLSLIVSIAFLHQYQREWRDHNGTPYILATADDYEIAYNLAQTVLFNTFQELEKPVSDFYSSLQKMIEEKALSQNINIDEVWFTRREIRQNIKLPDYLVHRYMNTLSRLEYIDSKGGINGSRHYYKLIINYKRENLLLGLTTPEELKRKLKNA